MMDKSAIKVHTVRADGGVDMVVWINVFLAEPRGVREKGAQGVF